MKKDKTTRTLMKWTEDVVRYRDDAYQHYAFTIQPNLNKFANPNFNSVEYLEDGEKEVEKIFRLVNNAIKGPRLWYPHDTRVQTHALIFPEISCQPHWHGVFALPVDKNMTTEEVNDLFKRVTKKVLKQASTYVREIYDIKGWTDYCTKFYRNNRVFTTDNFFTLPRKSVKALTTA